MSDMNGRVGNMDRAADMNGGGGGNYGLGWGWKIWHIFKIREGKGLRLKIGGRGYCAMIGTEGIDLVTKTAYWN